MLCILDYMHCHFEWNQKFMVLAVHPCNSQTIKFMAQKLYSTCLCVCVCVSKHNFFVLQWLCWWMNKWMNRLVSCWHTFSFTFSILSFSFFSTSYSFFLHLRGMRNRCHIKFSMRSHKLGNHSHEFRILVHDKTENKNKMYVFVSHFVFAHFSILFCTKHKSRATISYIT